jgi:hypothetical protein
MRRLALAPCLALAACVAATAEPAPAVDPQVAPAIAWYWDGDRVECLDATAREEVSANGVLLAVSCHWQRCATTDLWDQAGLRWEARIVRYSGVRFQYHPEISAWAACPEEVQENAPVADECAGYVLAERVEGPVTPRECYVARVECEGLPGCTYPWGRPPSP